MNKLRFVDLVAALSVCLGILALTAFSYAGPGESLDLNAATVDQLKALPGIGDAYAYVMARHCDTFAL